MKRNLLIISIIAALLGFVFLIPMSAYAQRGGGGGFGGGMRGGGGGFGGGMRGGGMVGGMHGGGGFGGGARGFAPQGGGFNRGFGMQRGFGGNRGFAPNRGFRGRGFNNFPRRNFFFPRRNFFFFNFYPGVGYYYPYNNGYSNQCYFYWNGYGWFSPNCGYYYSYDYNYPPPTY